MYHEIVHQILALSGLSQILTPEIEEAICEAMGHGIANFIVTNDFTILENV
jgi:hypothetical protein